MSLKGLLKSEAFKIIFALSLFVFGFIFSSFEIASKILFLLALLIAGYGVFISALRGILRRDLFDERFLMSIAAVGALILGDFAEGAAVMLFFEVGEFFQSRAVRKSRNAIRRLMEICPDTARIVTENGEETVDAEDVKIGTKILIKPGERVPIDAVVIGGGADIDSSMLTGEALPVFADIGAHIRSGSIVKNGYIIAVTEREHSDSCAAKILELVENASERKSKAESFITAFSKVYTPVVVGLAVLLAALPPIFSLTTFSDSFYRALSFLVTSCPCALVISVPMAFFGGIGLAAREGILFKGGNVFSSLSRAKIFAFDKTGTLTSGELTVSELYPYGVTDGELVSVAASLEQFSSHPIAVAIKSYGAKVNPISDFLEIPGKGTRATLDSKTALVGNRALLFENGVEIPEGTNDSGVFVALDGKYIGKIILSDKIKPDTETAIASLLKIHGAKCAVLSGDSFENATRVGTKVGISEVFAPLLPEEKHEKISELSKTGLTVFVGDGINDAPSLIEADVGIAMGGIGSDIAIESADVVIMSDSPSKIPTAIKIAKRTVRIAKENIVFALFVKLSVLALSAFGITGMWLAVFSDVGVAVLAILNSMRLLVFRGVK